MLRLFYKNQKIFLHRWNTITNRNTIMNCFEKIEQCHTLKHEDYTFCRKQKEEKSKNILETEDPAIVASMFYHF